MKRQLILLENGRQGRFKLVEVLRTRFLKSRIVRRERHEEQHRKHAESMKFHKEFLKLHHELNMKKAELQKYHQHAKYFRLIIIPINLIIWYIIFRFAGIKAVSISFALLISIGGALELIFHNRLEKTILLPISKLKKGVEEIAMGNYDIKVDVDVHNEIGLLADSFNDMAQKLLQSEKIKTEYEENRKILLANISHDLKTPITSIQGYIEAILDQDAVPKENVDRYLKIIHSNTAYMNKLIDDLFLFSKLDMQKLEFEFEAVFVKPFIQDLMEEFKYELEENHIIFNYVDRLDGAYQFRIDMKRLNQVFRNIIGNAVKHGNQGRLQITVKLYKDDNNICIDVEDNGPGIPADKLPHIFNSFYRIDTARTKDPMSTGLGLAIARELVEAHKGTITATSSEGTGTCFTVTIPVISENNA
jgi:Signal transduction histidine kinase